LDKDALDLKFCHKILVLDLAVSKMLWDYKKDEKDRWILERTPLFVEWSGGLRGTCRITRREIPPSWVIGGNEEYQRLLVSFKRFAGRHDPDRPVPLGIKRWEIGFSDEMDAVMFKLRWIG